MKIDRPSIIFNGYFKGTIDREADLRTFTSLSGNAALSVLENEDAIYYSYKRENNQSALRYMDNVLMVRNMMRVYNEEDGSITFITVNCSKSGAKNSQWHYTYSVSVVIVKFDDPLKYLYKPAKVKEMCFYAISDAFDKYRTEINNFRNIGFDTIKKKEQEEQSQNEGNR